LLRVLAWRPSYLVPRATLHTVRTVTPSAESPSLLASRHFRDGCRPVGEELQPMLAQHHVEAVILGGDRGRGAFADTRSPPTRDRAAGQRSKPE
jgi:hypothetical protein